MKYPQQENLGKLSRNAEVYYILYSIYIQYILNIYYILYTIIYLYSIYYLLYIYREVSLADLSISYRESTPLNLHLIENRLYCGSAIYFHPSTHNSIGQFVTPIAYLKLMVGRGVLMWIPEVWNSTSSSVRLRNPFIVTT